MFGFSIPDQLNLERTLGIPGPQCVVDEIQMVRGADDLEGIHSSNQATFLQGRLKRRNGSSWWPWKQVEPAEFPWTSGMVDANRLGDLLAHQNLRYYNVQTKRNH